jgi:processive 1,2-diacylglycerol beta-glucosyltransferase
MPPRRRRRVLLVYAVPYSGHAQAAGALHTALEASGEIEVEEYHFLQQFKYTGAAVVRFYKWMLTHAPSVWGHVHDNPDYSGITDTIISRVEEWDLSGLLTRVEHWKPDVIVAIQAFPLRILAEAKKQGHLHTPLLVVTTDFWAHRYWAHPAVDHYFVSSERAQKDLLRLGIFGNRISQTGIPLRPVFSVSTSSLLSRDEARKKLKWSGRLQTVLCLGGSYGFVPFAELLPLIELEKVPREWVMMFGKNKEGYAEAEKLLRRSSVRNRVHLYGFREDIHVFMRASDVAVTKAGGLSASEALVSRLPLVLYRPLPGQELKNVEYLVKAGVARRAQSPEDVQKQVSRILGDPKGRTKMIQAAKHLARPRASQQIVSIILRRFLKQRV